VVDHQAAVGGAVHVELHAVGTLRERQVERLEGVLGGLTPRPAVGEHQR
jgi:hypothetical protein